MSGIFRLIPEGVEYVQMLSAVLILKSRFLRR